MTEKTCNRCGKTKPIRHYYKHPQCKDGHRNQCKECIAEVKKQYYYKCKMSPAVWAAIQRQAHEYYISKKAG